MPDSLSPIGFIGLGVMGRPMALNLLKAGHAVVFFNRTRRPAVDELLAAGGRQADSPGEVAAGCPIVITMLADTPDVESVVGGPGGVLDRVQRGAVVIDMSTIAPAAAQRLARSAEERGAWMLDAPVSGGEIGAVSGTLSIMVGGDAGVVERVRPIFEAMGHKDRIIHVGPCGAGQLTKACNQLVIAVTLGGVSEAFALARKAGVDPAKMRAALLGGFAQSRVLDVHGQRILDGNYVPGFRAALFDKDLRIVLSTLAEYHVPAPLSAAASQLVAAMMAAGEGQDDYSGMARSVFKLASLQKD